jgi:HAD superfamily hydrolase (TIGR01450 family)
MIFDDIDALVCDLDGVVYRGAEEIAGSVDALNRLRSRGVRVLYCTNNSRSSVAGYLAKLSGLGLDVDRDQILTSGVVTAEALVERGLSPAPVLVIGGDGIREELRNAGFVVEPGARPDLVLVGWDPGFDYDAMRSATVAVNGGASLIATNSDASFPAADGTLWPGAGAILASIERATGVRAEVMGKPHAPMMDAIERRLSGARAVAAVGDRPDTDLAGARSKGWATVLVLSGVVGSDEVDGLDDPPDHVARDLASAVRGRFLGQ